MSKKGIEPYHIGDFGKKSNLIFGCCFWGQKNVKIIVFSRCQKNVTPHLTLGILVKIQSHFWDTTKNCYCFDFCAHKEAPKKMLAYVSVLLYGQKIVKITIFSRCQKKGSDHLTLGNLSENQKIAISPFLLTLSNNPWNFVFWPYNTHCYFFI